MENTNFQLILTEPNGNYAIPDIIISDAFETEYAIQSAADISTRKDIISKNITFQGTKNNNRIFNNLYSFNRESDSSLDEALYANYSPNVSVKAILYENNYPIASGTLKINDISRDKITGTYTYTGVVTGNLVTFFGKIKDVLLSSLDVFDVTIDYTWTNITNSWAYDGIKKYLFPQIDYGNGIAPRKDRFDIRGFRPAIYTREYVRAILSSQGYTYTSDFIDQETFGRTFIPFSDKDFGTTIFGNFAVGATEINHTSNNYALVALFGAFTAQPYITINRAKLFRASLGGSDFDTYGDSFTFNKTVQTSMTITLKWKVDSELGYGAYIGINKINDGNHIRRSEIVIPGGGDAAYIGELSSGVEYEKSFTLPFDIYNPGDEFCLTLYISTIKNIETYQVSSSVTFGNPDASIGSIFDVDLGDSFNIKKALPQSVLASDMLRDIFKLFNLYAIENPNDSRNLIIEPYDTFYAACDSPAEYALNWSKKVDNKTLHMKINTALPKTYNFKFKEDSDYYNTLYKNSYADVYGNFSIDNKNGSADAKNIEVVFSPTVVVQENGDDKVFPAIYSGDLLNKKPVKSNLRILFNNDAKSCDTYDIVKNYTSTDFVDVVPGVNVCQVSHHVLTLFGQPVFNLLFGIPKAVYYAVSGSIFDLPSLYSELYQNQLAELNSDNIFTLECDVLLDEIDVSNLDLRIPIFVSSKQGNAYFKIINLTYYNSQEVSKLVFQKVIL